MNQKRVRITALGASTTAALILICSGCTATSVQPIQRSLTAVTVAEPAKIKIADAQSPVAQVLRQYLAAAGGQHANSSRAFLSPECAVDLVTECQANAQYGWTYSEEHTEIESETLGADGKSAVVKARVVFHGGTTYMSSKKTFFFVLDNGTWKISGMNPPPNQTGPGFRPL